MAFAGEGYTVNYPSYTPSGLGEIEPVGIGTKVANLGVTYLSSAGIITTGLATGIGIALSVALVAYQLVTSHQKLVKAKRRARQARWQAFYDTGVGLIREVYGTEKYFDEEGWNHYHESDIGFGQYYSLGAMFYWWTGGDVKRDPATTEEDFRTQLLDYLKSLGLDPTRIMGYESVAIDEEINPQTDFVSRGEKILTAKEILIGLGYTPEQVSISDEEALTWIYDIMMIDLPNVSRSKEADEVIGDMDLSLKVAGLDPSIFNNKIQAEMNRLSGEKPSPTSIPSLASIPPLGWLAIIGVVVTSVFGIGKKRKVTRR